MFCQDCILFSKLCNLSATAQGKAFHNQSIQFQPGDIIFQRGSTQSPGIYCLKSGLVLLGRESKEVKDGLIPIAIVKTGAILGATSVFTGNYSHSAEALNVVDICFMPMSDFKVLDDKQHKTLYDILMNEMMKELNMAEQKMALLQYPTIRQRIKAMLKLIREEQGGGIPDDLSTETLARWLGTATANVNKALSKI